MARQPEDATQYSECFVAFIDILGFSDLVRRSAEDTRVLSVLTRALNAMAELPSGEKESRYMDTDGNWVERRWKVQTRAFSDTVVIFMPEEIGSISQILFMVRYLHDRMLELGLCMRGAVVLGGMYWSHKWSFAPDQMPVDPNAGVVWERGESDLPVTLGPGLIEAYKLESERAVYPRVLLSEKLINYVQAKRVGCLPFGPYHPAERPLMDFFRTDTDGLRFLDLLHPDVTRNDTERIIRRDEGDGQFTIKWERDGNTHHRVMQQVYDLISESLANPDYPDRVKAKYEWIRSYACFHEPWSNQIKGL